jgi:tRNA pseudouridine55 synthase
LQEARVTEPSLVVAVDKPAGCSSHDVVAWARRAFGTRAVGHAGTLDPAATGVLVLAVGEATKLVPYLTLDDKEYEATIELGVETTSLDADGDVVARAPWPPILTRDEVVRAASGFVGRHLQRAPVVSAIKRGGVALHERARRGEAIEAPEREVELVAVGVREVAPPRIGVHLHVGKGFYVRSFARDLAHALGTIGHLARLRRTRSGAFSEADAVPGELVRRAGREPEARAELAQHLVRLGRSLIAALPQLPTLALDGALERDVRHGKLTQPPGLDALSEGATCLLVAPGPSGARLVAIARRDGPHARVVRGFAPDQAVVLA